MSSESDSGIEEPSEPEIQPRTIDPGIFAVEDFLSEEQEAEVLKELADEAPSR